METFEPILNNQQLAALCEWASNLAPTPLQQARIMHRALAKIREDYKYKKYTLEERLAMKSDRLYSGCKPWDIYYDESINIHEKLCC